MIICSISAALSKNKVGRCYGFHIHIDTLNKNRRRKQLDSSSGFLCSDDGAAELNPPANTDNRSVGGFSSDEGGGRRPGFGDRRPGFGETTTDQGATAKEQTIFELSSWSSMGLLADGLFCPRHAGMCVYCEWEKQGATREVIDNKSGTSRCFILDLFRFC